MAHTQSEQQEHFSSHTPPPHSGRHAHTLAHTGTRGRFEGGGGVQGRSETHDQFTAHNNHNNTCNNNNTSSGAVVAVRAEPPLVPSLQGTNLSLQHSDAAVADMNAQNAKAPAPRRGPAGVCGDSETRSQFRWPSPSLTLAATPSHSSHKCTLGLRARAAQRAAQGTSETQ
eukprot:gene42109-51416_t